MIDDIERSEKEGREQIASASTLDEIRQAETDVLGKKAPINLLKKRMGGLDPDERRVAGQALNAARANLEAELKAAAARARTGGPGRTARGRAARSDRGAGALEARPPPPHHPDSRPARGRLRRHGLHAWPRAPRSRTTGTTSRPSTSPRRTRRAACGTRSTSTWATPRRSCCARTPRPCRSA